MHSVYILYIFFVYDTLPLGLDSPLQSPGNVPGYFGPIHEIGGCGIEGVIVQLIEIRPIGFVNADKEFNAGTGSQCTGTGGKTDFKVTVGANYRVGQSNERAGNVGDTYCVLKKYWAYFHFWLCR
jgi:hypothetical protein